MPWYVITEVQYERHHFVLLDDGLILIVLAMVFIPLKVVDPICSIKMWDWKLTLGWLIMNKL